MPPAPAQVRVPAWAEVRRQRAKNRRQSLDPKLLRKMRRSFGARKSQIPNPKSQQARDKRKLWGFGSWDLEVEILVAAFRPQSVFAVHACAESPAKDGAAAEFAAFAMGSLRGVLHFAFCILRQCPIFEYLLRCNILVSQQRAPWT